MLQEAKCLSNWSQQDEVFQYKAQHRCSWSLFKNTLSLARNVLDLNQKNKQNYFRRKAPGTCASWSIPVYCVCPVTRGLELVPSLYEVTSKLESQDGSSCHFYPLPYTRGICFFLLLSVMPQQCYLLWEISWCHLPHSEGLAVNQKGAMQITKPLSGHFSGEFIFPRHLDLLGRLSAVPCLLISVLCTAQVLSRQQGHSCLVLFSAQ